MCVNRCLWRGKNKKKGKTRALLINYILQCIHRSNAKCHKEIKHRKYLSNLNVSITVAICKKH